MEELITLNQLKQYDAARNTKTEAKIAAITDTIGQPNGLATLDNNGHVPVEQMPTEALIYKGQWDASTGTYPEQETYTTGDFYIVSVEGTVGGTKYYVGDWTIWNGVSWRRSANTNAVASVNGQTGAVVLNGSDINLDYNTDINIKDAIKYCRGDDDKYTFTYDNVNYTVCILGTSGVSSTWAPSVYTYTTTGTLILYKMSESGWRLSDISNSTVMLAMTPMMSRVVAESFIKYLSIQELDRRSAQSAIDLSNEVTERLRADTALQKSIDTKQNKISGGVAGQVWTSNGGNAPGWRDVLDNLVLPIGAVMELESILNANDLFAGTWMEI